MYIRLLDALTSEAQTQLPFLLPHALRAAVYLEIMGS